MPEGKGNYAIGVSSGWFSIPKTPELLGLAQKTASVATYGVNYVQVDFENTSEFFEPEVIERLRQVVDDLQIKWGAHGEIGEFMGWEGAIEVIWKQSHRRLHQYLDGIYDFFHRGKDQNHPEKDYKKYKPEYVNFHASNMPPIGLFVERYRYAGHVMLDFKGRENWDSLLRDNEKLLYWFKRNVLFHIFAREAGIVFYNEQDVVEKAALSDLFDKKKVYDGDDPIQRQREYQKFRDEYMKAFAKIDNPSQQTDEDKKKLDEILNHLYDTWLEMSVMRTLKGAITIEEWAYVIVAKYLEYKKDDPSEPLWKMFFGNKSMEQLEEEWSKGGKEIRIFDRKRGMVNLFPSIVAMVASRYIIGHFEAVPLPEFIQEKRIEFKEKGKSWDSFYDKKASDKLNDIGVYFTFETPEIIENQREGLQRIIHAKDIVKLAQAAQNMLKTKYIKGWFDSEHYIHNSFNPIDEIRSLDENGNVSDIGKYFLGFHVGAPKPYHPVHEPIDVGSEAQRWIYIYAYELRKRGFGVNDRAIIIFERGGARGGQAPINFVAQSATAIRLIVEELEKDTPPEKLPMSFFGVSPEGFASVERQMASMREHYWDPLKGMLHVPEEEHTFFSKAAIDHGKRPEDFKKEELR